MTDEKPKEKDDGPKKDMTIAEVVSKYPEAIEVFLNNGMGCFGCGVAQVETVEQGCQAHGIDVEKVMKELKEAIEKKKKEEKE